MPKCEECGSLNEEYLYDGECVACIQKSRDKFHAQLAVAKTENKRLRALCLRESIVLQNAVRHKHWVKVEVVAISLKEQSLKGETP